MRISDWSSDVCSSDLPSVKPAVLEATKPEFKPAIVHKWGAARVCKASSAMLPTVLPFSSCGMTDSSMLIQPFIKTRYQASSQVKGRGATDTLLRQKERSVGKAGVSTYRSRW